MRDRRLISTITWSTLAGLGIAVALSQGDLVSFRVWVFAAVIILTGSAVARMIIAARVSTTPLISAWRPLRSQRHQDAGSIRDVRALEGIVRDAPDNDRVFTLRLQPRLITLARHYLPITHGIDFDRDDVAVRSVLGDVAWLADVQVSGRAPTIREIDLFVDIVLDHASTEREPTP